MPSTRYDDIEVMLSGGGSDQKMYRIRYFMLPIVKAHALEGYIEGSRLFRGEVSREDVGSYLRKYEIIHSPKDARIEKIREDPGIIIANVGSITKSGSTYLTTSPYLVDGAGVKDVLKRFYECACKAKRIGGDRDLMLCNHKARVMVHYGSAFGGLTNREMTDISAGMIKDLNSREGRLAESEMHETFTEERKAIKRLIKENLSGLSRS